MQPFARRAAVALSSAALCAAAHAGTVPTYHIVDLGAGYAPAAINAAGVIVGTFTPEIGGATSMRYADGAWTAVASLPGLAVAARSINASGAMAGRGVDTRTGTAVAVAWSAAGVPAVIMPASMGTSAAIGIDDAGDAAIEITSTGPEQAYTWTASTGALTRLAAPLGGGELLVDAMNGKGRMAARALDANLDWQMVRGTAAGWRTIGSLTPGGSTVASGMNDAGHIACTDYATTGLAHACWYDGTILHDLTPATMAQAVAYGINASDEIVGDGVDAAWIDYAMLWKDGKPHRLFSRLRDTTDWSALNSATGINDAGQIIGTGTFRDGKTHAFLLNPVRH